MNGRIENRYEIGHHIEGLISTTAKLREAFDIAERWAEGDTGYSDAQLQVYVFDSMARHGQPKTWAFGPLGWHVIRFRA